MLLSRVSTLVSVAFSAPGEDLCLQKELLYDCTPHRNRYSWVCCNNERWAEHSGFLVDVDFFGGMERDGLHTSGEPVVFYDAKCGVPLFKAPVGRTWEAWKQESIKHGWPSFRREETIYEHVKEVNHGETVSSCGTHLGHNLPDSEGDRYCINLICMAGRADHTGPVPEPGDAEASGTDGTGNTSASGAGEGGSVSAMAVLVLTTVFCVANL